MKPLSRLDFERMVFEQAEEVLAELPADLRAEAETVLLEIADTPTAEQDPDGAESGEWEVLGLYEGIPLVERGADGDVLHMPDRITLFYQPLVAMCATEAELSEEIKTTLIHELGHFFGFDEDELDARGWG